ncbi:hypothetical protein DL765_005174 [Monosporascus sp. GIB2]|nr:hypothetical protein DL765_005174 [Monosporascus sp. GIB2]
MDPLAIVGFAFKLPQGIEDELGFWEVLSSHRNLMTDWPETRANIDAFYDGGSKKAGTAQEDLIRSVYIKAGLELGYTRYVEAHGTGTPIGDPIEIKAIGRVFRSSRSSAEPLYVGSVKSNIGHVEGTSGLAGILKAVMILEKGIIAPNAVFEKPDPQIDVDFYHTEVRADENGLERVTNRYEEYYKTRIAGSPSKLDMFAFTLAARRTHMPWRAYVVVDSKKHMDESGLFSAKKSMRALNQTVLAFIFTGQGAQLWGVNDAIRDRDNIHKPEYSQPLCTALQIALVRLLRSFGVSPSAVIGHSSGEIAAAYTTGALSLESALRVAYYRGQLAGKLVAATSTPAAMMSVNLSESDMHGYLLGSPSISTGSVHISCINSPTNCTISGDERAVDIIKEQLDKDGIVAQKLQVGVAYHSPIMRAISAEYLELLGDLDKGEDARLSVMVSSVTGRVVPSAQLSTPQYWVDNLVSPVRFYDAVSNLLSGASKLSTLASMKTVTDLVEVGPHCALRRPLRDIVSEDSQKIARYSHVLDRTVSASRSILVLLGTLFCRGYPVSILSANQQGAATSKEPTPFLVDIPHYPFDHSRKYWSESRLSRDYRLRLPSTSDVLGIRSHDWNPFEPKWRNFWSSETMGWTQDHISLELAPVSQNVAPNDAIKKLLYGVEWKPQLSLLSPQQLHDACNAETFRDLDERMAEFYLRLEAVFDTVVRRTLKQLPSIDLENSPVHLRKLVSWMNDYVEGTPLLSSDIRIGSDENLAEMLRQMGEERPSWKLYPTVASNIRAILRGDTDPLELVFSTGLAEDYYREMFDLNCDFRLRQYLDLASHENPQLRILEVGAGTGSMTRHILSTLQQFEKLSGGQRFSEYIYTDISPSFFENARKKFGDDNRVKFRTFDLESGPERQGFTPGVYDMVVAGSVLHATKDLAATLRNLHKLLTPRGQLVFLEILKPRSVLTNLVFGVLPGWWLSVEDWRAHGPAISQQRWDQLLKDNGFSGNELVLRDHKEDSLHLSGVIVSRVQQTPHQVQNGRAASVLFLVVDERFHRQVALASAILDQYKQSPAWSETMVVSLPKMSTLKPNESDVVLSLLEVDKPFLYTLSKEDYGALKETITRSPTSEVEFIIRNGRIETARLYEEIQLNEQVQSQISARPCEEQWLPGPPLKLSIATPGMLDTLSYTEDPGVETDLGPGEVEIQARVWALSFRDLFVALGRLEGQDLGHDCAGVVTRASSESGFKPGDRIAMVSAGCMRTYPRSPSLACVRIPDSMSFETGASCINPGITAYHCLVNVARLQKGERILVHSASGSTGQMAISVAKMLGAEIYATVGFDEKRQLLVEQFGIPAENIFYSRNTSFAQGVMRRTNGCGVDVILNSLSGDGLRASWECMAPFGRFIEIGKTDIMADSPLPMSGFARNISFTAVDLHHLCQTNKTLLSGLLQEMMDLVISGRISYPTPLHVYTVANVEAAFRYMQGGRNTGRIVISVQDSEVVQVVNRRRWKCPENASYLVAGGLGATALSALLENCAQTMPPIRGCINAAMVLQDAVFENMSHAQWELTLRSKAHTAWNLHQLLPSSLDFFVLLSSLAGIYGNPAQANYAAGCAFQDAVAHYRTRHGQKAVSFDIGWMRTIGIIAETELYQRKRVETADMGQIEDDEFIALLNLFCDSGLGVLSPEKSQVLIGVVTPSDLLSRGQPAIGFGERPLFAAFTHVTEGSNQSLPGQTSVDAGLIFRQATGPEERARVMVDALSSKLVRTLSISPDDIDTGRYLSDYGVDSLMAVELRNWISNSFSANVTVFDIMGGTTIAAIGDLVARTCDIKQKT